MKGCIFYGALSILSYFYSLLQNYIRTRFYVFILLKFRNFEYSRREKNKITKVKKK